VLGAKKNAEQKFEQLESTFKSSIFSFGMQGNGSTSLTNLAPNSIPKLTQSRSSRSRCW
jgi:hypothetical protein